MDKIDQNTYSENANFKFDDQITSIFDTHVRKSVPMYEDFHKMIAKLSDWFIEENTNVYDIGSSTGEVFKNIIPRHKNKRVRYFGIDKSESMIKRSKNNFNVKNVSIISTDITKDDIDIHNASYITSVLTLQFISKRKRQEVINKIYQGLNEGSAFIMVEKIIGNNARFDEIFIELYHDFKINNGLSEKEVINKSKAIRGVITPKTLDENMTMLKNVGFKNIDIFFKYYNFIGFIAIK